MSLKKQAAQGVMWIAFQGVVMRGLSTAVFFVLARLLDPSAFGLMALVSAAVELIDVLTNTGFNSAIVQRKEVEEAHLNTAFWFGLALKCFMTLLMVLGAPLLAALYDKPEMVPLMRALSVVFILKAFAATQIAILTREMNFRLLSVRTISAMLSGAAVGLAMALLGYGIWSLVMQQITAAVVGTLALWWVADWRPKWSFSMPHLRQLYSFGFNLTLTNIIFYVRRNGDELLIGYFLSTTVLGYYVIALKLIKVITEYLTNSISGVLLPTLSKLQDQPSKVRQALYSVTKYTSMISFPVFLFFIPAAPDVVPFVFGDDWNESIPLMQIVAVSGIINSVFKYNGSIMLAMNKPQWATRLHFFDAVTNTLLLLVAIPFGITAVVVATVARAFLISPLPLHYLKKLVKLDYKYYLRQFAAPMAAALIGAGCVWAFGGLSFVEARPVLVRIIMKLCLFGTIYLAIMIYALPEEIKVIAGYARRGVDMGRNFVLGRR